MPSPHDNATDGSSPARQAAAETVTAWPPCPGCGEPRQTVCPICSTAGSDFPRADEAYFPDADQAGPKAVPLICPTCDEPFRARFLRCCPWCGHDSGEGLETPAPLVSEGPADRVNGRVLLVTIGLVGIVGLVGLYLAWIAENPF